MGQVILIVSHDVPLPWEHCPERLNALRDILQLCSSNSDLQERLV